MRLLYKFTSLVLVLLFAIQAKAQDHYLQLQTMVTDNAGIFTSQQHEALQAKLVALESETTNQLVVLTINELGYESIEMYANGTFNQNGLGQAEKDNGILLLFAKNNREVRIEVGYGLEATITDAIASRIIRNTMIPEFKGERYFQGINFAVDELILYLSDPEALEKVKEDMAAGERKNKRIGMLVMALFIMVFVVAGGFLFYKTYGNLIVIFRGFFTGKLSVVYTLFAAPVTSIACVFALVFSVGPLVAYFAIYDSDLLEYEYLLQKPLMLLWIFPSLIVLAMLIAYFTLKRKGTKALKISWLKSDSSFVQQTFTSSGSSSYSSGFGGSSGGFSGGGGSSGGGGASGSW